jgi:hypothetical protein
MNAIEIDSQGRRAHNEEQARIVMGLLREYSGKLAALATGLLQVQEGLHYKLSEAAWLIDQSEVIRKPLLTILSRGSGLRENAPLEPITRDELSLRMFETEVHLHHTTRMTLRIRELLTNTKLADQVAKMRVTAGLPVVPNG